MKKSQSFFALLIFCLSFVLIPAPDIAAMWDVPVAPGQTFRWVFVTSGSTDATSPDISYYNDFVNDAADIVATPITGVLGKSTIADIEWKASASTESVDAIDNIGYSLAGIFTPRSRLVANGTLDLFDGSIMNGIIDTELPSFALFGFYVWSGSEYTGLGYPYYTLGAEAGEARVGRSGYTDNSWITDFPWFTSRDAQIYAISEDLRVVPAPGALILGVTGLLSLRLNLNRLRRKHQE